MVLNGIIAWEMRNIMSHGRDILHGGAMSCENTTSHKNATCGKVFP